MFRIQRGLLRCWIVLAVVCFAVLLSQEKSTAGELKEEGRRNEERLCQQPVFRSNITTDADLRRWLDYAVFPSDQDFINHPDPLVHSNKGRQFFYLPVALKNMTSVQLLLRSGGNEILVPVSLTCPYDAGGLVICGELESRPEKFALLIKGNLRDGNKFTEICANNLQFSKYLADGSMPFYVSSRLSPKDAWQFETEIAITTTTLKKLILIDAGKTNADFEAFIETSAPLKKLPAIATLVFGDVDILENGPTCRKKDCRSYFTNKLQLLEETTSGKNRQVRIQFSFDQDSHGSLDRDELFTISGPMWCLPLGDRFPSKNNCIKNTALNDEIRKMKRTFRARQEEKAKKFVAEFFSSSGERQSADSVNCMALGSQLEGDSRQMVECTVQCQQGTQVIEFFAACSKQCAKVSVRQLLDGMKLMFEFCTGFMPVETGCVQLATLMRWCGETGISEPGCVELRQLHEQKCDQFTGIQ